MKAGIQLKGNFSLLCSFPVYLQANLWSPVWEFRQFDILAYHRVLPWFSPLHELKSFGRKKITELVSSRLRLCSALSPSHISLFVCRFLSADPSAWMKMTPLCEFKGTPHKAITNKPDVPHPPFPLCRGGREWGQVPFSKNEFSNFS